jgi:hypothetical protein
VVVHTCHPSYLQDIGGSRRPEDSPRQKAQDLPQVTTTTTTKKKARALSEKITKAKKTGGMTKW